MLNQRMKAAKDVADHLFAFENAIDHAVACGGNLAAILPIARVNAGLSATVGQEAFESVVAALGTIVQARKAIIAGHIELDTTKAQIGLRERAFGDGVKLPTDQNGSSGLSVVASSRAA